MALRTDPSSPAPFGRVARPRPTPPHPHLSADLFDINGYLHLKGVLTPEETAKCNAAIDHHRDQASVYGKDHENGAGNVLSGGSEALRGTTGRSDLGNFIGWEKPWRDPFRELMVHPRIVAVLNEILGKGFRLVSPRPPRRALRPHPQPAAHSRRSLRGRRRTTGSGAS